MATKSPRFILHEKACSNNFWYDTCTDSSKCCKLHFRNSGSALRIVNCCINVNRVERRCKAQLGEDYGLENTPLPTNTELLLVDSQIDPEDFGNSLRFNNPKILVARAIGLHPSTVAPSAYHQKFLEGLIDIASDNRTLVYAGPFGGHTNVEMENRFDPLPAFKAIAKTAIPISLASSDISLDHNLGPQYFTSEGPHIIWTNANKQTYDRSNRILDLYIKVSDRHSAMISSENYNKHLNLVLNAYLDVHNNSGDRILYQSDSINRKSKLAEILPLAVVNNIVDTYVQLSKDNRFQKFCPTLAKFNTLITAHALVILPKERISASATAHNSFKARSQCYLGVAFSEHHHEVAYGLKPKLSIKPRFEGSMVDRGFVIPKLPLMDLKTTQPIQTTPPVKRRQPNQPHNLVKEPTSKRRSTDTTTSTLDSGSFTWTTREELDSFLKTTLLKTTKSLAAKTSPASAVSTRILANTAANTTAVTLVGPKDTLNLESPCSSGSPGATPPEDTTVVSPLTSPAMKGSIPGSRSPLTVSKKPKPTPEELDDIRRILQNNHSLYLEELEEKANQKEKSAKWDYPIDLEGDNLIINEEDTCDPAPAAQEPETTQNSEDKQ